MVRKRRKDKGGQERKTSSVQRLIARIPPGWLVVMVFCGLIGSCALVMGLLRGFVPGPFSQIEECRQQCLPRKGQLENDKDYPMSAKGQYRQLCRCVW